MPLGRPAAAQGIEHATLLKELAGILRRGSLALRGCTGGAPPGPRPAVHGSCSSGARCCIPHARTRRSRSTRGSSTPMGAAARRPGMNVEYARCAGSELLTADGRRILDFNSGYCVHNVGHNHPHDRRARSRTSSTAADPRCSRATSRISRENSPRGSARCAGGRLTQGVLRELGKRRRRDGHQVLPRVHRSPGILYARGGVPRAHVRRALADGQSVLDARDSVRSCPDTRRCRSAISMRSPRELATGASRRSSSSRSRRRRGILVPPRGLSAARRRRSAGATARSSCSTRCRPASTAPARSSRRTTSASSPTWSCSPRR